MSAIDGVDFKATNHTPIRDRVLREMRSGEADVIDGHNALSVKQWNRMGRGLPCAGSSAIPWAILHARTFAYDVLSCAVCCGGASSAGGDC